MAVLVGIDEAGYGPILGPLVVSSAAFAVPAELLKADLWHVLNKSISNRKKHLAGRLLIADSKKAHNKRDGIKHLQRTVLSCLSCLEKKPVTAADLLSLLCPDSLQRLSGYPWHKNLDSHKIIANEADIAIACSAFMNDMGTNDMKLLELRSSCLDVAHYNKMVNAVKNKSRVLFTAVCQLMKTAFDNFGEDELQIVVDRQGGLTHYRPALQRMFEDMGLKIIEETDAHSSYELTGGGRKMKLHFVIKADDRFMPVSLASMVCKLLRELLVSDMNRYFLGFSPELKPTAGYWKDGLRFIEDLKKHIPHVQYDPNQMIRCR